MATIKGFFCLLSVQIFFVDFSDLEKLRKTSVRTAYSDSKFPPDYCYLKMDVEKR